MPKLGLRDLCALLASRPGVFTPLASLCDLTDAAPERLVRVLAKLQQIDIVGIYQCPETMAPLVYLTHKAGAVLRIELSDDDDPRWQPIVEGKSARKLRQPEKLSHDANERALRNAESRRVDYTDRQAYDDDEEPEPYTVHGLGVQWPISGMGTVEPKRDGHDKDAPLAPLPMVCPGCAGRPLGLQDCCVICDRSGFDRVIGLRTARREKGRTAYRPGRLRGGIGA